MKGATVGRADEDFKAVVSGLPRVALAVPEASVLSSPETTSSPLI